MRRLARSLTACALAATIATGVAPAHADQGARVPQVLEQPATGLAIAQTALAYVGAGYAAVGQCTGLVHRVFAQYGYVVPYDVPSITAGYPYVAPQNIQPGDVLIFANTEGAGLSHVAIYVGGGWMVGADNPGWGVHRDYLYDGGYWQSHWYSSVRIAW